MPVNKTHQETRSPSPPPTRTKMPGCTNNYPDPYAHLGPGGTQLPRHMGLSPPPPPPPPLPPRTHACDTGACTYVLIHVHLCGYSVYPSACLVAEMTSETFECTCTGGWVWPQVSMTCWQALMKLECHAGPSILVRCTHANLR